MDDFVLSDHGNWNVAADYARLKIMKPLYFADEYETIATFGFLDFEQEMPLTNVDLVKLRGFKRLIKSVMMVINNSIFAVKKNDKIQLNDYMTELKRFYKIIKTLYNYRVNEQTKTKELVLIPEKYDMALERVIEIKSLINEPLNKYDLIFTHKEDFDAAKAKKMIKDRLTTVG